MPEGRVTDIVSLLRAQSALNETLLLAVEMLNKKLKLKSADHYSLEVQHKALLARVHRLEGIVEAFTHQGSGWIQ
jgi:hypothetical protein